MKKAFTIAAAFLIFSATIAQAMTGYEFVSMGSIEQYESLKPTVDEYVRQGYRGVPNQAKLSMVMVDLIRKNGYGNKDADSIALEAAILTGMTK